MWEASFAAIPSDSSLRSLLISKLIDLLLSDIVKQKPRAPLSLLSTLQRSLVNHSTEYYKSVVDNFDRCVVQITNNGFSAALGQPLFFACPQQDGTILELFPHGASVAVTEENHKFFLRLLLKMKQKVSIQLRDLPVSPKLHRSGNYYPLACLIIEHLTNVQSQWCIDNEEDWNALDMLYCVPFNGHMYDISPGMRNERVPFANAISFGINARRTLLQLMEAYRNSFHVAFLPTENFRRHVWIMSRGYLDFLRVLETANTPLGRPMSVEEFNNLHLTYSIPFGNCIVPLFPGGEGVPVEFERRDHFVSLSSAKLMELARTNEINDGSSVLSEIRATKLSSSEKKFWDAIEGIRRNPEIKPGLSFVIKIMNQTILLRENGGAITVTRDNVQEYINLICAKKDVIHAAFVESDIKKRVNAARIDYPVHSGVERLKSLECYPPWNAPSWNTFTLEPSDLGNEMFQIMQGVKDYKDIMKPEDYGGPFFSFAIPIRGKGLYHLLPRGDTIPVTCSNYEEFLERLHYEKRRLQAVNSAAQTSTPWEKSLKATTESDTKVQPGDWVPPICTVLLTANKNENTNRHRSGASCRIPPDIMTVAAAATLDELDMYEANLLTLKKVKDRVSLKVFEDFSLRYALLIGGQEVELLDGGRHRFVAVQELDKYVDMALSKLNEIRDCILTQNRANDSELSAVKQERQ